MTQEELAKCYVGDWVQAKMWDGKEYLCQICRFDDYNNDGIPDKALIVGPVLNIVSADAITFVEHDRTIQELLDKCNDNNSRYLEELKSRNRELSSAILGLNSKLQAIEKIIKGD